MAEEKGEEKQTKEKHRENVSCKALILETYNVVIDRSSIFQALSQLKYKAVSAHDNDGCAKTCK